MIGIGEGDEAVEGDPDLGRIHPSRPDAPHLGAEIEDGHTDYEYRSAGGIGVFDIPTGLPCLVEGLPEPEDLSDGGGSFLPNGDLGFPGLRYPMAREISPGTEDPAE